VPEKRCPSRARGDDLVAGLGVAADLDAVDVDLRTAGDAEADVERLVGGIDVGFRRDVDEGVAAVAVVRGDFVDVLAQQAGLEHLALLGMELELLVLLDALQGLAADADVAEAILLALVDLESDRQAVFLALDLGLVDADVDEAVLVVRR
jgi:hypothetical protein